MFDNTPPPWVAFSSQALKSLCVHINNVQNPFFFYDLDSLKSHLESLVAECTKKGIVLFYSCKANPLSAIIQETQLAGMGVDFASKGEFIQVYKQGFSTAGMICTGPAKTFQYFKFLISNGVHLFVIESPNQLRWLNAAAKKVSGHSQQIHYLLRVQLIWDEPQKNILGGNQITPFGMDKAEWEALLKNETFSAIDFLGIHIFQWSNLLDLQKLNEIWERSASTATDFCNRMGLNLSVLDLGGGLGIPYHDNDNPLSWPAVTRSLSELREHHGIKEIWIESGRFAIGPYGLYGTRIIDRKSVRGQHMLILEGGIHHLLKSALIGSVLPCLPLKDAVFSAKITVAKKQFHLYGPLCTAQDYLGCFSLRNDLCPGDWLLFFQAGSYGFTQSMPLFICHDWPGEIIFKDGQIQAVRDSVEASVWLK